MQVLDSHILSQSKSAYNFSQKQQLVVENISSSPQNISRRTTITNENLTQRDKELMQLSPKDRQMLLVVEALLGKEISVTVFDKTSASFSRGQRASTPTIAYEQMQEEASSLDLAFKGSITTKKGKQMNFSLSVKWKEKFAVAQRDILQQGQNFNDPLIITLDGDTPVTKDKFDFKLNKNASTLNRLKKKSGYLAFDKNDSNKIDDGSELFGVKSGDGFADLAKYDEDKNGWIDSNDTIFKSLRFWSPSKNSDSVKTLKEVGIGAISLQSIKTDFISKEDINKPTAYYKEASVAVGENAQPCALFSVDLAG